ncbi:hypothetical protein [Lederbergia citrea]|uniref:hypothetical protein n=1 Tax=Lederbergia citrea TaxID=2833581 RepID=UPI001BC9E99C|nr:hypothetical protein [Lederbergia citrea]MBS4178092.1 hypothetical protein [Lederbergia citrea]
MMYQTRIFKGLLYTNRSFFQLEKAEVIYGLRTRISWLFLASALVFLISGLFGIGSHVVSPELLKSSPLQYEGLKSYFIIGRIIHGLLYAGCVIFLPALFFWMLSDTWYTKMVVLQAFTLPILLVEQTTFILMATKLNLPWFSSPFSLGVLAQYLTDYEYLIYLLGSMSLFKLVAMVVQYEGLRTFAMKSRVEAIVMVLSINLIFWAFGALQAFINFKMLL